MELFKNFVSYLKDQGLRELASLKLKSLHELDSTMLLQLHDLPEEETTNRLTEGWRELLEAMETGNVREFISQKTTDLLQQKPEGKKYTAAFPAGLLLTVAAERNALISIIPSYTKKSSEASSIMLSLEEYYTQVYQHAFEALQRIQEEEVTRLTETEEQYKDLFDNASDLIQIVKPSGEFIYVNNAWTKTLGYAVEELQQLTIYDLVAEREVDRFRAYRERIIAGLPAMENLSTVFKSRDGKEIIVEGFLSCKFKNGKPQYTRGILRDTTQRKHSEQQIQFYTEQLVEREENIRQLIRNAPDAIVVIDRDSKIKLWNPKAEEMFGWQAMDIIGKLLTETIIPPSYRKAHLEGMDRYLKTGEAPVMNRTIEITALNSTGKEFAVSLTISSTTQGGEKIFIAFIRDITEYKQNVLELERKKEQLERSNKELEQFAWLASHDMKEPLRKIRTFSDLMIRKKDSIPANMVQLLQKIQHSAARMNNLIEDLLSYGNVSSDQEHFVQTDLNLLLQDVLIDLEMEIKDKKAKINAEKLPVAEVLPFQIRQLFQNLISNALKYSKPDEPPLIEIKSTPIDEGKFTIAVSDNGIGFKTEYSKKVFQIFQRLVSHDQYEGTGIGLALCKKILENHSGTITAESEEGKGSRFVFILPLKQNTSPHA